MELIEPRQTIHVIDHTAGSAIGPARHPGPFASLSARFFRTRPADPSEARIRRYLEIGAASL